MYVEGCFGFRDHPHGLSNIPTRFKREDYRAPGWDRWSTEGTHVEELMGLRKTIFVDTQNDYMNQEVG